MKKSWKYSRWLLTAAVAGFFVVNAGAASADLATCQNDIDTQAIVYESAIFKALASCKNLILKEQVKNLATAGSGSIAGAAAACEAKLKTVYGAQPGAVAASTAIGKFRAQCAKWRTGKCTGGTNPGTVCTTASTCTGTGAKCGTHCRDEDINAVTGIGHLTSGAGGNAPPSGGDLGKFMCDWILIAKEKMALKQQLFLIPTMTNILLAAQTADPEKINAKTGIAAKKGTACTPLKCVGGPTPGAECLTKAQCGSGGSCNDVNNGGGSIDSATFEYRPNLCRFGVECRDHACSLAGTSQATLSSAPLNGFLSGPFNLGLIGNVVIEFCQLGQKFGVCKDAPFGPCQANSDCPASSTNACNVNPGEGLGSLFGAEPNIIYLINEPTKSLKVSLPASLASVVAAVCVDNVRSEGWCDCTGTSGVPKNTNFCIDGWTGNNGGPNDDCGSPLTLKTPSARYPGSFNGAIKITPSGPATAGSCLDLQTTQFTIILTTTDFGADTLPCTGDDFGAPSAPAQLPITTGTAIATINDATVNPGLCSVDGSFCLENVNCPVNTCAAKCTNDGLACTGILGTVGNCNQVGPNLGQTCGTCSLDGIGCANTPACATNTCPGATLTNLVQGPLTGAGTSCTNYQSSNLTGLSLVGAFPALGSDFTNPLGDSVTAFKIVCN